MLYDTGRHKGRNVNLEQINEPKFGTTLRMKNKKKVNTILKLGRKEFYLKTFLNFSYKKRLNFVISKLWIIALNLNQIRLNICHLISEASNCC